MAYGTPKKHHYVPQFYLRRFACPDDDKKVPVLEVHRQDVVTDQKSISGIGYEDHLHDYELDGVKCSIEGDLNEKIETPFSNGKTWHKIVQGRCSTLDETDRLPIYGFARHLQNRNLAMLSFMETQLVRYQAGDLEGELTESEREMYSWIMSEEGSTHELFRAGAMDTDIPEDAGSINVAVCYSEVALRSSTSPLMHISFPGNESIFGDEFSLFRTWWLPLDRHWGAMIIAGGPPGLSVGKLSNGYARVFNQRYLCQLLKSGARYLIADDLLISDDLEWAGYSTVKTSAHGFRFSKVASR